jgi:hypothetical protein
MNRNNLAFLIFFLALFFSNSVLAYTTQSFGDTKNTGDFLVKPVKTEISLDPGKTWDTVLSVANRNGKRLDFKISLQDFTAKDNVELVENSPYSLRDYIFPDTSGFYLEHGQVANIPVKIEIPPFANPGSMHIALVVSTNSGDNAVSQIASIFLVTVKGKALVGGNLENFVFNKKNKSFDVIFKNSGNVYLNPKGKITVKGLIGKESIVNINEYFVLPNTSRLQKFALPNGIYFGKYKAKIELYKGFGDVSDYREISFWLFDKNILIVLGVVIVVGFLIIVIIKHKQKIN